MAERKHGDLSRKACFEQQALPHLDALYTMATRLARNPDDANDLLQETVLRAYRFFHQFTPGTNIRAWLLTILYNNFRNGYRRTSREQPASSSDDFDHRIELESLRVDPNGSNLETEVSARTLDRKVSAALDSLPEEFRNAILLVDMEELSYQEVATVLTVPVGTVKSRVSRGRALLRQALRGYARERGIVR
ncbi:MAG TPA: sigma-70 family RNA polymerase sigma factor [Candidatus Binataceae bacterium]|nr:sigma-70 family RNA polymerase sigma factor [Candidatus Binataceae bacterium]